MRDNRVRRMLADGQTVFGTMISTLREPAVVQIMVGAGFDFIMVDMEHGPYDMVDISNLMTVARLLGITPFVRVADCQYHIIARSLDAGAQGVMIPRVESVDQVRLAVDACRYPPIGKRGASVTKGHNDYLKAPLGEFVEHSNREVMLILQIEREAAVRDIDALLSFPGVDAAVIGPNDLSISLGTPGDYRNGIMTDAIQRVVSSCEQRNLPCGMHVGDRQLLRHWMERGMRLVMCSTDVQMLYGEAGRILQDLRA